MRKGIRRPVYFPRSWNLERCFKIAAESGYEGMELIFRSGRGHVDSSTRSELIEMQAGYRSWQSLGASVMFTTTKNECHQIEMLAAKYGLSIAGSASGYSAINEPGSPAYQTTHAYISKAIEHTNWLGGQHVLISFEKASQYASDATARKWTGTLLKHLGSTAAQYEVNLAYEIVWPALYQTPDELLEIIAAADNDRVGVYFDPANVLQHIAETGEYIASAAKPEEWLRAVLAYVKSVHMKDYTFETGFVDLLTGDVNWPVIHGLLQDAAYEGWLVAELEVDPVDHLSTIQQSSTAIDCFLNS
jgi:sugar phosphate isomerase/epimerase